VQEGGVEAANQYSLVACYAPRSVQNFLGFCHDLTPSSTP
jgi:hypothetical protein